MTRALPRTAAEITPDWLSQALRSGGLGEVQVRAATLQRIGQDQGFSGGGVYRIALRYGVASAMAAAPASIVAKLSPADPALAAGLFAANRREAAFYQRIAGQGGLAVPRSYFAAVDPSRHASLILLQDLGQARSVPFVQGLSQGDAAALVDALARIHARWWQRPELGDFDGMALLAEFDLAACWSRYPARLAELLGDIRLPGWFVAMGDHLVAHQHAVFAELFGRGPVTCLHRDIQADNVLFDAAGQAVLLDWQIMGRGRGTYDVAYALISSLTPAIRRACEGDLVARYLGALHRLGVSGYDADACWRDYRRAVAGKFFVTVVATVLLDNATAHKLAWRRADLERLMAFCTDHQIAPATFG